MQKEIELLSASRKNRQNQNTITRAIKVKKKEKCDEEKHEEDGACRSMAVATIKKKERPTHNFTNYIDKDIKQSCEFETFEQVT